MKKERGHNKQYFLRKIRAGRFGDRILNPDGTLKPEIRHSIDTVIKKSTKIYAGKHYFNITLLLKGLEYSFTEENDSKKCLAKDDYIKISRVALKSIKLL